MADTINTTGGTMTQNNVQKGIAFSPLIKSITEHFRIQTGILLGASKFYTICRPSSAIHV